MCQRALGAVRDVELAVPLTDQDLGDALAQLERGGQGGYPLGILLVVDEAQSLG